MPGHEQGKVNEASASASVDPTPPDGTGPEAPVEPGEPWRWCPRCSHELHNERCKLRCPRCHYFMSCSDFD